MTTSDLFLPLNLLRSRWRGWGQNQEEEEVASDEERRRNGGRRAIVSVGDKRICQSSRTRARFHADVPDFTYFLSEPS
jgi:hypothetical protein